MADETRIPGFGSWLSDRMHARRMSQRQLASRSGVNHSTVSRLLRGSVPTLATALALQDALDPGSRAVAAPDSDLHPAVLSAMLRRDGLLTNDEIDFLVSAYAGLVDAHLRLTAGSARRIPTTRGR